MHSSIYATGYVDDERLRIRLGRLCAKQGWQLQWLNAPTAEDLLQPAGDTGRKPDLAFIDHPTRGPELLACYPGHDLLLVRFYDGAYSGPHLTDTDMELAFDRSISDEELLNALTVSLNLNRFRHQFEALDSAEPITQLPHHTDLLEAMGYGAQEPAGLMVLEIDHAQHLYAHLDPVSKTDLLTAVAESVQQCLPEEAQMAIYDATCFAVWIPGASRMQVRSLSYDVLRASEKPVLFRSGELHATFSIGTAQASSLRDPHGLWQDAWQAKQRAHIAGGNRVISAQGNQEVQDKIPEALERDEFSLALQPQYDIEGQALQGVEALLRWQGMEVGSLLPDHFIPLAERTGQMTRVGDWVLEQAAHRCASSFEHYLHPLTLGINVSPQQFSNASILDRVRELTANKGLNPAFLELELSHENLLQVIDRHRTTLYQLRDLGVRIAIDKLGIGVVDTSKLLRCPADTLKIDRGLIAQITLKDHARQLAAQICELGRRFNLRVVAVGVETEAQRDLLAQMGCQDAQGYLFAAPMTPQEFAALTDLGSSEMDELAG